MKYKKNTGGKGRQKKHSVKIKGMRFVSSGAYLKADGCLGDSYV